MNLLFLAISALLAYLIGSIPVLGKVVDRLEVIPGLVPNLIDLPAGCRFAPRCQLREKFGLKILIEASDIDESFSDSQDQEIIVILEKNYDNNKAYHKRKNRQRETSFSLVKGVSKIR